MFPFFSVSVLSSYLERKLFSDTTCVRHACICAYVFVCEHGGVSGCTVCMCAFACSHHSLSYLLLTIFGAHHA